MLVMIFLKEAQKTIDGVRVFECWVKGLKPFGVVEFDKHGRAVSIEEKTLKAKSDYIIPGLYCYNSKVIELAEKLKPSRWGKLEITDLNATYMES